MRTHESRFSARAIFVLLLGLAASLLLAAPRVPGVVASRQPRPAHQLRVQ